MVIQQSAKAYLGHDDAFELLEEKKDLLPRAGSASFTGAWGLALYGVVGLAMLGRRDEAAASGKWDVAEDHFQSALRQAHEIPHRLGQVEGQRWYARMLIDRDASGDVDKARDLLKEAIAGYTEIGMVGHLKLAEGMLGEVGG